MHRIALCAFAILLVVAATALAQETLDNPGFEFGSPDNPTSWSALPGNDPNARIEATEVEAFAGARSARISCTGTDPRIGKVLNCLVQTIDATPYLGKTLTVGVMCRTEDIPEGHAAVLQIVAAQSLVGLTFLNAAATTRVDDISGWSEICASVLVPVEAHEIHIRVGLEGIGTVWFDEIFLSTDTSCQAGPGEVITRLPFVLNQSAPARPPEVISRVTPPASPRASKPWTIAIYVAAETGFNPRNEFANALQTCDQYNVIMLSDSSHEGGKTWRIDRRYGVNQLRLLANHGEVDMSAGDVFTQFLQFCEVWYPSERMMLLIYNHGGAWRGTAKEPVPNQPATFTWLSPAEIRQGLDAVEGVDVLLYTAPCNMASIEAAYEIGASANLNLAAEEYSGYDIWSGVLASLGGLLQHNPAISLEAVGDFIIDGLVSKQSAEAARPGGAPHPTFHQTAYWGRAMDTVVGALKQFASALIDLVADRQEQLVEIRKESLAFRHGELVDLGDFAERCGAAIPALAPFANAVLETLEAAAFRIEGVPAFANAHGLNVFFPLFHDYESAVIEYEDADLCFLADTRWEEFLETLYTSND